MRTIDVRRVTMPDGTKRILIHWFETHSTGAVKMPQAALPSSYGPLRSGGAQGRIACMPNLGSTLPLTTGDGLTKLHVHSDDPRAVTCPACKMTDEYKAAMAEYASVGFNKET